MMGQKSSLVAKVVDGQEPPAESWRVILRWTWKQLPQLVAATAIGAAALFFIGWQYKQSLALNFGLSAYPGDMSFQSTVATGVTVFDASNTLVILAAFICSFVLILMLRSIPRLLRRWLDRLTSKEVEIELDIKNLREKVDNLDVKFSAEDFMTNLNAAKRRYRWLLIERNIIRYIVYGSIPSLIVIFVSSFLVTGFGLYLLFKLGNSIAINDAQKIRTEARGPCSGCFLYFSNSKSEGLLGVPVFQSQTSIYIQEYDGLYQLELSKLEAVKPFMLVSNKPLTSPRR